VSGSRRRVDLGWIAAELGTDTPAPYVGCPFMEIMLMGRPGRRRPAPQKMTVVV
jgi:hypothetical protein